MQAVVDVYHSLFDNPHDLDDNLEHNDLDDLALPAGRRLSAMRGGHAHGSSVVNQRVVDRADDAGPGNRPDKRMGGLAGARIRMWIHPFFLAFPLGLIAYGMSM